MIRVRVLQEKKELEIPGPARVADILREIGAKQTTTVVLKSGVILTPDREVEDGETVDVLSVVSGG
ncbi:MAG: thiamine biosynthesis protein ThiS [Deltaproteobacteria bacterium]|nr:MAG: thiamine biosynthesis protein ThiS [Deltaproteobacteria bacterium]